MAPTIETGKRVTMLAVVGGIGATVALLIAASHNSSAHREFALSLNYTGAKIIWEIATAGVFCAAVFNCMFVIWIWRLSPLQGWLIKVPVLSGVWAGTCESGFFKDENGRYRKIEIEATIDHRFDQIIYRESDHRFDKIVYREPGLSEATAFAVDFRADENGEFILTIIYHNVPQSHDAAEYDPKAAGYNIRKHDGCARMTLARPPRQRQATSFWTLHGNYWTNKSRFEDHEDRGTTGLMELHWKRSL